MPVSERMNQPVRNGTVRAHTCLELSAYLSVNALNVFFKQHEPHTPANVQLLVWY